MAKTYFTLTGTKHYYGSDFLEKGMKIILEKEPDNEYDKEAIQVKMKGMGKIDMQRIVRIRSQETV